MLSAHLLAEVRRFAPLMELRGYTLRDWALAADTTELTLKRYLGRRCRVGDEDILTRLLHEAECFIVVRPDGPLTDAWSASLKAMVESSFENALRH
jgi:hypothetical protein